MNKNSKTVFQDFFLIFEEQFFIIFFKFCGKKIFQKVCTDSMKIIQLDFSWYLKNYLRIFWARFISITILYLILRNKFFL